MGVLNVTPDSFSDGGLFASPQAAATRVQALIAAGADIVDVGGESTRPGATPVDAAEELARVMPAIRAAIQAAAQAVGGAVVSIDTRKAAVARAAVAAGSSIWNDVSALRGSPDSLDAAAELGCGVVLMHMLGEPATMQDAPRYDDVVAEVAEFLAERAQAAQAAGVSRERIWLDPGIGFGKRPEHNLALIANLDRIVDLGFPVLVGVSRKRTVEWIDSTATDAHDRLGGSLAMALRATASGAAALRVHDVRETVQALKVWSAIDGANTADGPARRP